MSITTGLPLLAPVRTWLRPHRGRLWLALRMTIAAVLAFAIATAFDLPQGYWAVLTTIIVTQNSVVGSLKAAVDRLVGSVCGALLGGIAAVLLPSHAPLQLGFALVASVAPLALLTAFSPGYRIAPITAIIVLMSTGGATLGPLYYALYRILEITLGSVIGLAVSLVIAPVRAYTQVRQAASQAATLLAALMAAMMPAVRSGATDLGALSAPVRAALGRLDTAVDEAARERRSHLSDHPDPEPLSRTLRRLHRDILALNHTLGTPWPERVRAMLDAPWSALATAVEAQLRSLAGALVTRDALEDVATLHISVATFTAAIDAVRRARLTLDLSTEVAGRILGSVFLVEQLHRDLDDLAERVAEAVVCGR